jgi:hypothetical protein
LGVIIDFVLDIGHALDYLLTFLLALVAEYPASGEVEADLINQIARCRSELVAWSQELGLPKLVQKLETLSWPQEGAAPTDLQTFGEALRSIVIAERNLAHRWELSTKQWESLAIYLQANQLLVECLNLTTLSNREAIEARILLVA